MSRMSLAYQCWEIGGRPGMGYKLAHGQAHPPQGHQYVSEASLYQRHHSTHDSCGLSSFLMYMQGPKDSQAHHLPVHPKDTAAQFAAHVPDSAHAPLSVCVSPHASGLSAGICAPPQGASSSLTTESDAKVSESGSPTSAGMQGRSSEFHATILHDQLKVKGLSSKPGVVGRVPAVVGMLPSGPVFELMGEALGPDNSSQSTSSVGFGSEDSSCTSDDNSGDTEAQSAYHGPLNEMSALESSLPIKRPGLSKFFGGKSRSFSCLADVSSVNDLAKPNNPYAKRRRMGFPPLSGASVGGISKRLPSSGSRSNLAVAVKLGGLEGEQLVECVGSPLGPTFRGPEKRSFPARRSFSLTELPAHGSSSSLLSRHLDRP